jgi:hypothetical protein
MAESGGSGEWRARIVTGAERGEGERGREREGRREGGRAKKKMREGVGGGGERVKRQERWSAGAEWGSG